MKASYLKKVLCCTLAAVLVLPAAVGCGKKDDGGSEKTSVKASATSKKPYAFSMYGNLVPELNDADNAFFKELSKKTNTKIDVTIPPSADYNEALTVTMASGDYPDVIMFQDPNAKVYQDAVKNGVIIPVNQYLKKASNINKYSYDVSMRDLKIKGDDKIYGIPRTSVARGDGYIVRKDWLDKLGIKFEEGKPITRDQFTEILKAFTTKDPDGNGANDTFGLGNNTGDGNLSVSPPIAYSFGLNGWQKAEGEKYPYMDPTYSEKNDTFQKALTYMNELWEKKYIDPDWPTLNQDAMLNRFYQGKIGVIPEFSGWLPDKEALVKANNPNAELAYIVGIVDKEGDKVQGGGYSTGMAGVWGITTAAKNPQKIVDVLDYMLSDDFWDTTMNGVEGVAWNYDKDKNKIAVPNSNYLAGRNIVRRNNSPEFFVGVNTPVADRERITNLINTCIDQAVFSLDEGYRPEIADDPAYIDADKERNTVISKIIAGDLPVDKYDDALKKWYKAGGETFVKQINAHIEKVQKETKK